MFAFLGGGDPYPVRHSAAGADRDLPALNRTDRARNGWRAISSIAIATSSFPSGLSPNIFDAIVRYKKRGRGRDPGASSHNLDPVRLSAVCHAITEKFSDVIARSARTPHHNTPRIYGIAAVTYRA